MNSRRRIEYEPAFILHSYPYKETSLIVEAFSRNRGRAALLARGARRPRSAMRGVLHAFQPLRLTWTGSGDLSTLIVAEWQGGMPFMHGFGLMCGFYVNELILRLLPREDPHEDLYDHYVECLRRLASDELPAAVLRGFEKRLLASLGYAMLLDRDASSGAAIDPGAQYLYDPERGPLCTNKAIVAHDRDALFIQGQTLIDLDQDNFSGSESLNEARGLMRSLIARRLNGQTLHTRSVLLELQDL